MERKQLSSEIIKIWARNKKKEASIYLLFSFMFFALAGITSAFLPSFYLLAIFIFLAAIMGMCMAWRISIMDFWEYRRLSYNDADAPEKIAEIIYE